MSSVLAREPYEQLRIDAPVSNFKRHLLDRGEREISTAELTVRPPPGALILRPMGQMCHSATMTEPPQLFPGR